MKNGALRPRKADKVDASLRAMMELRLGQDVVSESRQVGVTNLEALQQLIGGVPVGAKTAEGN